MFPESVDKHVLLYTYHWPGATIRCESDHTYFTGTRHVNFRVAPKLLSAYISYQDRIRTNPILCAFFILLGGMVSDIRLGGVVSLAYV